MVCKAGQLAWQALDNGTQKVFVKPLGNSASNLISPVLKDTIEEKSIVNSYHYSNGPHRPTRRSLRHSDLIYIEYAWLLIIVIIPVIRVT